ncbi:DUF3857 domain-containing protein [Sphingobacterium bambusae]|uniref:DUF3857 domain-containing protein n=1 Tax=Sphingobacterium bambusae TaxID=662858 RepID=A0ABW6BKH1_9SPHI|nr:DUF3857 domain-containing protein [Sphingobacterium bambusae]WPL49904.1 DUF2569 family protein [Sphingobacterium bambusae]
MKLSPFFGTMLILLLASLHTIAAIPTLTKSAVPNWIRASQQKPVPPNLEDISEGYYFERIEYQVNLATQTRFFKNIKVLTENAGAENAGQIHLSFNPQYQTLVLHELYLLREGERIDRLKIGKFELMPYETELSRSIYNGSYAAYLLLEDLRKDDKIILSYSVKGANPVFAGKFFDTFYLQGFEPVGQVLVNYVVPKDRKLQFKGFLGAPAAQQQDLGSAISYYWDVTDESKADYEPNTPFWYATRQRVECSEFSKWSDVGKWASDVNPIPTLQSSGKLSRFADQLWQKSTGDSMTYAQLAADFVQNDIRYMGIEVGEYSHRANSPEKVFAQRYGDCKDKSVLLAALLKHKGILSELILAHSTEDYGRENYLPAPSAFNHMVLYFRIDGRGQYIDPTITNQGGPFRDRYFPFYGKVLPATAGAKLRDTEKIVAGNTRIEERFYLNKDGAATVDVVTIYTGPNADNIRSYFKQNAKNQIEKSYLNYYQKLYKQASKRAALTYEDDLANNIFRVREFYTVKQLTERDPSSNRLAVSAYATNLSSSIPEALESRLSPIALQYPLTLEHDVYLINPDDVDVPPMQENSFIDRESYYFGKNIKTDNDTLKISFRLGFHDSYVKANQVANYISDFGQKNEYFSAAVFLDDDGFITGSNTHDSTNYWSIFAFVGLLALFAVVAFRYYNSTAASSLIWLYEEPRHDSIGGWLALLAIGLFFSPIRVFFTAMLPFAFNAQVWSNLTAGNNGLPAFYMPVFLLEFAANTFIIFLSGYCCYLLMKKRDIFPQTVFFLMLFQLAAVVFDAIAANVLFNGQAEFQADPTEIVRSIIFAAIWTSYIFKSTRVKGTFVLKYGETLRPVNFHHDAPWDNETVAQETEIEKAEDQGKE